MPVERILCCAGQPHAYEVVVGEGAVAHVHETEAVVLLTDQHVHSLHGATFEAQLRATGIRCLTKVVSSGEASKSRAVKASIEDWMLAEGCPRNSCVVALGGGVVGDLAGFVAATYMRGVPFIQVPTTLLAMVDASVGGKTAINTPAGKNLVGAFHQPRRVYCDPSFLRTLPDRELRNGLAEAVKTAAVWDAELFAFLESSAESALARRGDVLARIVADSVRAKAAVVSEDEREGGLRAILNWGHTVGHGLETLMQPDMLHGECVAVGCVKEAEVARALGHCSSATVGRMRRCLSALGLPTALPGAVTAPKLLRCMTLDKKNAAGSVRCVMLERVGRVASRPYARAIARPLLARVLARSAAVTLPVPAVRAVLRVPGSKSLSNISCPLAPPALPLPPRPSTAPGSLDSVLSPRCPPPPPSASSALHRVLLLAALARGTCRIRGMLHSEDTTVMVSALRALGASVGGSADGEEVEVVGTGGRLTAPTEPLALGNAGTAARFLAAACTLLRGGSAELTGSTRMRERPIGPLVDALRASGCAIHYLAAPGSLPLRVEGGGLPGGEICIRGRVSSQFVSALLLSAPLARSSTVVSVAEARPTSLPYILMTLRAMRLFGVEVRQRSPTSFEVPAGGYAAPEVAEVEADASSATYPLAMAAVSGGDVTVEGVGADSVQGDAAFCALLQRMGCTVTQGPTHTRVVGPPRGQLQPLPRVDMADQTDAFMTLAACAAVAGGRTRIEGVSNQRVKECDRISAMAAELAKAGVETVAHEDGLTVVGRPELATDADAPEIRCAPRIQCYDDHRIAMSFAVLACAMRGGGVVVEDKDCVGKTYPEFWDDAASTLGLSVCAAPAAGGPPPASPRTSIVLVGMRCAGKSSIGRAAAAALGWVSVDVDDEVASAAGLPCAALIRERGWEEFRRLEAEALTRALEERGEGAAIACGGGVVESGACRQLLARHPRVVWVRRPIQDIERELGQGQGADGGSSPASAARPPYPGGKPPAEVYAARSPLYDAVADFHFPLPAGAREWGAVNDAFLALLVRAGVQAAGPAAPLAAGSGTFFLCLAVADVREVEARLGELCADVDAVELRVDRLARWDHDSVVEQVATLRDALPAGMPIVFTVRSRHQGGAFGGTEGDLFALLRLGIRLACEYVDVECCWSLAQRTGLLQHRASSRIIASYHEVQDGASPASPDRVAHLLRECTRGGEPDVVKVVTRAHSAADVALLRQCVEDSAAHGVQPETPVIAVCTTAAGSLSRVLNGPLTPVTHPALPAPAAPGQLSAAAITQLRTQLGLIPPRSFYLFGRPISKSPSPHMHNAGFRALGLPHAYHLCETADVERVAAVARDPAFGGASVTIPLKEEVAGLVDRLSDDAAAIGAVNTLVREADGSLKGDNTDWLGILRTVGRRLRQRAQRAITQGEATPAPRVALVVGAGGTARSACYAAKRLGCRVLVHNRTASKAEALASRFGGTAVADLGNGSLPALSVILSTVPAEAGFQVPPHLLASRPVVLDAAYGRTRTSLLTQAAACGCPCVEGIDMLLVQGVAQFRLWSGRRAPVPDMEAAVRR